MKLSFWGLGFVLCAVSAKGNPPKSVVQSMTEQQMIADGRQAFLNRCSGCHGATAEGNGPASVMLNPKPRNLVSGSFKFHSTPPGILPTIEDMLRTIDRGIPLSSMPSFSDVPEREKLGIVLYLRSLRPDFHETSADQVSLPWPSPPKEMFATKAGLLDAAKRGKIHYAAACILCHGPGGKGDGPSAPELTDADNVPIAPADLTSPTLKNGPRVVDIFRAVSLGTEGSPMPAFLEMFDEKKRWEITAYVLYLRGVGAGIYPEGTLP